MRRIRVVGTSGSGKTRLARRVAQRLNLPHLELDALQHQPGWQPAADEQFDRELRAFLAAAQVRGGWVIDGNYAERAPELFDVADTIVWLDYPRPLVMTRIVRRSLGRVVFRRTLWNGNRESLRTLLTTDPQENVVLWAWRGHEPNRRHYERAMAQGPNGTWTRLRTPAETRAWLKTLPDERR